MNLTEYLSAEWRPALGCTEPAAVAYAACLAAGQAGGSPRSVQLVLDARTYKNCHAVGIPNSGHQSGVLWALALGAVLPDPSPALQIFESVTPEARAQAARLLALEALQVEVDATRTELYISCTVGGAAGVGRAVLEQEHTRLVLLEANGVAVPVPLAAAGAGAADSVREQVGAMSLEALGLWAREQGHPEARIEEALALACLLTTATTQRLGTLSAVCGASNAAGIGIAAGLVHLGGGGPAQLDLAIQNMVGNLAGLICDGAKVGCAMKAMTGVEAAFRSASLALAGVGIPATDGIVGAGGAASLENLGRLAQRGMAGADTEILAIMQAKLGRP